MPLFFLFFTRARASVSPPVTQKRRGGNHKTIPQELEEQLYLVQQRYALELERSLQYSRAIAKPGLLVANSGLAAQTAATRGMRP